MKTAIIQMTNKKKDELDTILSLTEFYVDCGKDDIIEQFTAKFKDTNIEADIKICNGDGPYLDAVLFENGNEIEVLDASWEKIPEEFIFYYLDEIYKVIIEIV